MKKLNLGKLNLTGVEVLTRNQLKNVLGGGTTVQTTGGCSTQKCFVDADCTGQCYTCNVSPLGGSGSCSSKL